MRTSPPCVVAFSLLSSIACSTYNTPFLSIPLYHGGHKLRPNGAFTMYVRRRLFLPLLTFQTSMPPSLPKKDRQWNCSFEMKFSTATRCIPLRTSSFRFPPAWIDCRRVPFCTEISNDLKENNLKTTMKTQKGKSYEMAFPWPATSSLATTRPTTCTRHCRIPCYEREVPCSRPKMKPNSGKIKEHMWPR